MKRMAVTRSQRSEGLGRSMQQGRVVPAQSDDMRWAAGSFMEKRRMTGREQQWKSGRTFTCLLAKGCRVREANYLSLRRLQGKQCPQGRITGRSWGNFQRYGGTYGGVGRLLMTDSEFRKHRGRASGPVET